MTIPQGYELVWSDEFDGNTLDESKWWSWKPYTTREVTGGGLNLMDCEILSQKQYLYGYFEFRAKLTDTTNKGYSNIIWMLNNDAENVWQEIDLMETSSGGIVYDEFNYGINKLNSHIVHGLDPNRIFYGIDGYNTNLDLSNTYHVYALEWTVDHVRFYFDDFMYHEIKTTDIKIPDIPLKLIITQCKRMNVSDICYPATELADNSDPLMYIDYVRVYQKIMIIPQEMKIGVLEGWGWGKNAFVGVTEATISEFQKWPGIDVWKLAIMWDWLEPQKDVYDETCFDHIKAIMDAAFVAGAKVQLDIGQTKWPLWINGIDHDDGSRYTNPSINQYLIDAWKYIAIRVKDHPALESYLILNEEDYIPTYQNYVESTNIIISAIREIDTIHKINIRLLTQDQTSPNNNQNQFLKTYVNIYGIHDLDNGTSGYCTGAQWSLDSYESPISYTSYMYMAYLLRVSPLMNMKPGGIGEIGFNKGILDSFGDEEKLIAFERAMSIAYDMGYTEFDMWSENFRFTYPQSYFPRLKSFRDSLLTRPRLTRFNVRVLNDTDKALVQTMPPWSQKLSLDIQNEPYYHLIRYLDEAGYSWIYTDSYAIESIQPQIYDSTIRLSEIYGKTEADQDSIIADRLRNVVCANRIKTWSLTPSEPIEQILPETTSMSTSFFLGIAIAIAILYKTLNDK